MALRFFCKDYNLDIIDAQYKDFIQAIGNREATVKSRHSMSGKGAVRLQGRQVPLAHDRRTARPQTAGPEL
jgi:hypothetical protein